MLLTEFEPGRAVIEPELKKVESGLFEVCDTLIYSFNGKIVNTVSQMEHVREGGYISDLNGKHPWYIYEKDGLKVAIMMAIIGAASAVGNLEELRADGFKNIIVLGSCGVLDKRIEADKILIPSVALRDEGTSYHYAPASDEISYNEALLLTMEKAFDKAGIEHVRTKTWTTDAFFRETADKVKRRMAVGAEVVDMEASALMAWAQFRQANVYQFFYTADYVDHHNQEWDKRHEERTTDVMTFFEVALVIAKEL